MKFKFFCNYPMTKKFGEIVSDLVAENHTITANELNDVVYTIHTENDV